MRNILVVLLLISCSLLSAEWSEQRQNELIVQAKEQQKALLTARPSFHWPFDTPTKEALRRMDQDTVVLFSYGSLINEESAMRTLGAESLSTRRPAIAFGVSRRFDYDPGLERYTPPTTSDERAMLNLTMTGQMDDIANGVVVELSKNDLIALSEREIGYDLVPVVVVNWDDATGAGEPTFYTAYTFRASDTEPLGVDRVNPNLLPRADYYNLVVEGASGFGDDYLQLWHDTTYLGDGNTPVREWADGKSGDKNGIR